MAGEELGKVKVRRGVLSKVKVKKLPRWGSESGETRLTGRVCVASQEGLVASCLFRDAGVWTSCAVFVACKDGAMRSETNAQGFWEQTVYLYLSLHSICPFTCLVPTLHECFAMTVYLFTLWRRQNDKSPYFQKTLRELAFLPHVLQARPKTFFPTVSDGMAWNSVW